MKASIIGKLLLSIVIVGWAVSNLVPLKDTPFEEFIAQRPTSNQEEFQEILERAENEVDAGNAPSLYVALRDIGQSEDIDFHGKFFSDINLVDIKNLKKRNETLMRVLLKESQGQVKLGLDLQGGTAFTLRIDETVDNQFEQESRLDKAIEIMSKRVNGLGVAEPLIRAVPPDGIEIQMPGLSVSQNPGAADSLTRAARLELCLVHRTLRPGPGVKTPLGYRILVEEREDRKTGKIEEVPYFVKLIPEATGSIIKEAGVGQTPSGGWEISLSMTSEGADKFGKITKKIYEEDQRARGSSKGALAIVLDGELYSAPGINEPILTGRASITGNFSQREAVELANVLNNPLEFDLKLDEMYEVGPTLAEDARDASIKAAMLGAGLVIIFMVFFYFSSGIIAVISVILNLITVLGILASLGATITLPGVAALVLTIGMAVDANILIFERIREELTSGKSLKNALEAGYSKAYSTIIDANVTTMITAFILIWLGTGPVKGFGVTLAIGIGSSMFAALVISRLFLETLAVSGIAKQLMPFWFKGRTSFNFLERRKPAFIASWIIVAIGLTTVGIKGDKIYGIEFLGGSEVAIEFTGEKPSIASIFEAAEKAELGEIIPVYQRVVGQDKERLKVQTSAQSGDIVFNALNEAFPEAEMAKVGENVIGASVSSAIKKNAIISVMFALVGILLYVALRFEFGYGIGAVVATVHDVLMTIGIFVLFGNQFTAPMLAAILMIVGYSINDTIVVFDRIREELDLNPELTLSKVVNLAINRTLSRTALTSVTTFLAAMALLIFGEGVIHDFAFVFIVGILTGTFSSIFIASPVFYWWHKGDRHHVEERELTRPTYEWEATSKKSKTTPAT